MYPTLNKVPKKVNGRGHCIGFRIWVEWYHQEGCRFLWLFGHRAGELHCVSSKRNVLSEKFCHNHFQNFGLGIETKSGSADVASEQHLHHKTCYYYEMPKLAHSKNS